MRISLPSGTRRTFERAWGLLSPSEQTELRSITRSVRLVESLANASVKCADGTRLRPRSGEGAAFYGCENTSGKVRGFLLISRALAEGPADFVIATILHELAHGLLVFEKCVEER
jgi:hypothetical protein